MEKNENNLTKEEIQIENMRNDLIEILEKEQENFREYRKACIKFKLLKTLSTWKKFIS